MLRMMLMCSAVFKQYNSAQQKKYGARQSFLITLINIDHMYVSYLRS